jgi:hypothetical protein
MVREGRVKRDSTDRWPPQMRVKVSPLAPPKVYDSAKNEIPWESEPEKYARHTVKLILQVQPVWFVNKMFGLSVRLHQMIIIDAPVADDSCMFIDDNVPAALTDPSFQHVDDVNYDDEDDV